MGSNIIYDKPFKTYEEQMQILESRNITINNPNFAKQVLSSLSYYTIINGYKNTFLSVTGSDCFVDGTTFDSIYTLHIIDTNLNSLLLKYILFVERYLKTRLSYLVSQNYGVYTDRNDLCSTNTDDYLCRNYYSGRGKNNTLREIKNVLSSPNLSDSVAHYANDKNHIPAWILITSVPLGLTIRWYSILKPADKQNICEQFIQCDELTIDEKKEFFIDALNLLRKFRNNIAHGNRTFNISNLPVLPKKSLLHLAAGAINEQEYNAGCGKNDTYAVILLCFLLIDDSYILRNFLADLGYTLSPYNDIDINGKTIFEVFRLPNDIFDRLTSLLNNK